MSATDDAYVKATEVMMANMLRSCIMYMRIAGWSDAEIRDFLIKDKWDPVTVDEAMKC